MGIYTKEAYAEVNEIIKLLGIKYSGKIPSELIEFFEKEKEKAKDYIFTINPNIPIKEQNLKEETLAIIAFLNLKYWCEDENEKQRLKEVYKKNEEKYQIMLQEKYNPDNLFKKKVDKTNTESSNTETQMICYKPLPFYKKIINKIRLIFKLKTK